MNCIKATSSDVTILSLEMTENVTETPKIKDDFSLERKMSFALISDI